MANLVEEAYMDLMARGKDIETARYIGKYLHRQSYHVRNYTMSAGWVFPGWVGFSKWFKKESGNHPPREMVVKLAGMSKAEREEHAWSGLSLWETRKAKGR